MSNKQMKKVFILLTLMLVFTLVSCDTDEDTIDANKSMAELIELKNAQIGDVIEVAKTLPKGTEYSNMMAPDWTVECESGEQTSDGWTTRTYVFDTGDGYIMRTYSVSSGNYIDQGISWYESWILCNQVF